MTQSDTWVNTFRPLYHLLPFACILFTIATPCSLICIPRRLRRTIWAKRWSMLWLHGYFSFSHAIIGMWKFAAQKNHGTWLSFWQAILHQSIFYESMYIYCQYTSYIKGSSILRNQPPAQHLKNSEAVETSSLPRPLLFFFCRCQGHGTSLLQRCPASVHQGCRHHLRNERSANH